MMLEEVAENRTVVTTVSMPFLLYVQLLQRAKFEGVSLSELVRRALYKEFEMEKKQKGIGKG